MRSAWLLSFVVVFGALASARAQRDGTPHFWPATAPGSARGPSPQELLGFRFGQSRRAAERACRRAGHDAKTVHDGGLLCAGPVEPRELPAQVHLRFCEGELCEARASIAAAVTRVGVYARALQSLRSAFGPPPQRRLRVDHQCLAELVSGRSDRCLTARGSGVRHWWDVNGTEIFLALEHRADGTHLEVSYRTAERLRAISRTSD